MHLRITLFCFSIIGILFFSNAQSQPDRKYGVMFEVGSLQMLRQPDYVSDGRRLRVIILKHFDGFSLGTGFGLDGYYADNTAPLFLDARYYKFNRLVPFLTIGNAMKLGPEFDHGLMVNGGVMATIFPKRQWLKGAIGYNYQRVSDRWLGERVGKSSVSVNLIFSVWN